MLNRSTVAAVQRSTCFRCAQPPTRVKLLSPTPLGSFRALPLPVYYTGFVQMGRDHACCKGLKATPYGESSLFTAHPAS